MPSPQSPGISAVRLARRIRRVALRRLPVFVVADDAVSPDQDMTDRMPGERAGHEDPLADRTANGQPAHRDIARLDRDPRQARRASGAERPVLVAHAVCGRRAVDHGSLLPHELERCRDDHVFGVRAAAHDDSAARRRGVDRRLDARIGRRPAVRVRRTGNARRRRRLAQPIPQATRKRPRSPPGRRRATQATPCGKSREQDRLGARWARATPGQDRVDELALPLAFDPFVLDEMRLKAHAELLAHVQTPRSSPPSGR